ncbi:hypothetical protein Daura_45465 [Dactylosporangium aurantiacum]|uniref:Uncharacterized protein n=1 Tax=Dactylosporangium aurantiacum TaxID=35754 RepID=A0A9Q9IHX2_9ACTN|nr:hypothetical protein [Dactylosporangium aurantiacum]MDG6108056.1 hypothetical protein [Dactylosporangium aurantiacum]UWZ53689.1 hypothetical protein Daura_45465 [Dactylosporangium aurantiacum]
MPSTFTYPTRPDLQRWAEQLGLALDEGATRRQQRQLRIAVQLFTKSVLCVLGLSVLLAWLAVHADTDRIFWILYSAAILAPLLAVGLFRTTVAGLWPETAVRYYLTALIDRLRDWAAAPDEGLRYLRKVIPPLERSLLSPALQARLAGSQWARKRLRARFEAVLRQLGEAELHLLNAPVDGAQETANQVIEKLGVLLLAVSQHHYAALVEPAEDDPPAARVGDVAGSWGRKLVEALSSKGLDWAVTALASAMVAVGVPVLRG